MKQYRLQSKAMYALYVLVIPCLCLVGGTFWIYLALTRPEQNAPFWFGTLWLAAVLYGSYRSLKMPYLIKVAEAGLIRFVGVRTTTVSSHDVISVRTVSVGFLEVKYRGGKIWLLQQFTGFHEFLTELKRTNPNVELRGC